MHCRINVFFKQKFSFKEKDEGCALIVILVTKFKDAFYW